MKYSISPFIKIFFVTLIILITFPTHLLAYTSNSNALSPTEDDFDLQPGDIILTKGQFLFGFFGHSSIALDHDTVLQIEGPGTNPLQSHSILSNNDLVKAKMIGLKSTVVLCLELERAAKWAEEHYKDTDKTYLVTLNLKSERFTYCTKIIYQAYKYGVSKNSINEHGLLIISPYALVDNFTKIINSN